MSSVDHLDCAIRQEDVVALRIDFVCCVDGKLEIPGPKSTKRKVRHGFYLQLGHLSRRYPCLDYCPSQCELLS